MNQSPRTAAGEMVMSDEAFREKWQTVVKDFKTAVASATYKAEFPNPAAESLRQLPRFSVTDSRDEGVKPVNQPIIPDAASVEILSELARGGMGIVFRGHQNSLKREIAIKQLLPEISDEYKDRFVNEALVNAYLDHPNIVPVHELGVSAKGDPLICMKLVQGQSWKTILANRPLEPTRRQRDIDSEQQIRVLLDICDAISYAHSKGILHLDLKPDNIMIGEFGEVMVMDWGIAVEYQKGLESGNRTVPADQIDKPMGTPGYMGPELANGDGPALSPKTDVYLLGGLLYEILMDRPPHLEKSFWMTIISAREGRMPPFKRHVPAELRRICTKALAKNPEDRYPNVNEFKADLGRYLATRENKKGLLVCALFTGILSLLGVFSYLLNDNQDKLNQSQATRYDSLVVATELRTSSEDLTAAARAFVETGEAKYEERYWHILDVRNGKKPRSDGRTAMLRTIMAELGVTEVEFAKLKEAEDNSNELVAAEEKAFNAIKGRFIDENGGFTVTREPDHMLARELVFGDDYYAQKEKILGPIDEFIAMIEQRTQQEVEDDLTRSSRTLWAVIGLIIGLITLAIGYYILLYKKIRWRYAQ